MSRGLCANIHFCVGSLQLKFGLSTDPGHLKSTPWKPTVWSCNDVSRNDLSASFARRFEPESGSRVGIIGSASAVAAVI